MDNFNLRAVSFELQRAIPGRRIERAFQVGAEAFYLELGKGTGLTIDLSPDSPLVFLTGEKPEIPDKPSNFAMLIRKYISGGRITDVFKKPDDRILTIKTYKSSLILELINRTPNMMILSEDGAVKALYHKSPVRKLELEAPYIPPEPRQGQDPFSADPAVLKELPEDKTDPSVWVKHFNGISPLFAKEIIFAAEKTHGGDLYNAFTSVMNTLKTNIYSPSVYSDAETGKCVLSCIEMSHLEGLEKTRHRTMSEAAQDYYTKKQSLSGTGSKSRQQEIKRLKKALDRAKTDYDLTLNAEEYKKLGDILLASGAVIRPGDSSVRVPDVYDGDLKEIEVKVDGRKNLYENADSYFKKYKKLTRGKEIIAARIAGIEKQIAELEAGDNAGTSEELQVKPAEENKTASDSPVYRKFTTSGGYTVLVGKSAQKNDVLTFDIAAPDDFWLHADRYSGSHVVVRNPSKLEKLPPKDLEEAASIAAFYSRARNDGKVEVAYTKRKRVRKGRKMPAGQVLLDSRRTIKVKPFCPGTKE